MSVPKKKKSQKKIIIPKPIRQIHKNELLIKKHIPHKYLYLQKKQDTSEIYIKNLETNPWIYFKKIQHIKYSNFFYKITKLKCNESDAKNKNKKKTLIKRLETKRLRSQKRRLLKCIKKEPLIHNWVEIKRCFSERQALIKENKLIQKKKSDTQNPKQVIDLSHLNFYNLYQNYYKNIYQKKKIKYRKVTKRGINLYNKVKFLRFKNNREIHNVWKRRWYYIPHSRNKFTYLFNDMILEY